MGQEKAYSIRYHRFVPNDVARLDPFWFKEISAAIEYKLRVAPQTFGKPLRYTLSGCRALRVGDYRVVFSIERNAVRVLGIVHRSVVYQEIEKRLGLR